MCPTVWVILHPHRISLYVKFGPGMDKIGHCVTCLKIGTYMSGKNAETFSLIRFGVFIESPKRFFKSPKPSGNPAGIVRSLGANYAVVGAESSGR